MRVLIGLLSCLVLGCASTPQNTLVVRYQSGDNPEWSSPDWEDTTWQRSPILDLPDIEGVFWLRFTVSISDFETLGLAVSGAVAREIYWDGIFIGQAGQVGQNYYAEQPGSIDAVFRIPDSLATPGIHTIAVRASSFKKPGGTTGPLMTAYVGELVELKTAPLRSVGIPLLFLGGFILVALYYGRYT